ncbi:DUF4468 domain-containing protein [Spirosoma pollinicola]|uniref:DUF4468 domain-containing protein n=1 Tax=Spirosoma pollinicola TaxID=2057025 RepID=A0A2K8YTT7_9BACT|nr:DUF4468 domain-containing protein [Spirosoma pollinicola]AUD00984.1 hypothetical protein CWM47_03605 [Spirosoma pollinicola]
MKILFTLLLFSVCLPLVQAQKNFVENGKLNGILPLDESGNVVYQIVKSVEGVSKDELYKRGRKWFVKSFSSAKDVLQVSDGQSGELSAQAITPLLTKILRVTLDTDLSYTLLTELKDGRYRLTLTNVRLNNQPLPLFKLPYIGTTQTMYTTLYTSVDTHLTGLLASLEKALQTADDF